MRNYFIDYLSMHQVFPKADLPIFGDKMVLKYDIATGDIEAHSPTKKAVEGSYTTKLFIRCNDQRVSVEGNPSRFQRPDNLFGYSTIDECVNVYNHVLGQLALPSFTKCRTMRWHQSSDVQTATRVADGAVFTRIDWTKNYAVGQGDEATILRGLSTQSIGRGKLPFLYPNGHTLDWGKGSEYWYQKIYNKAHELTLHLNKSSRNKADKQYVNKLIDFCNQVGLLRHEKEFKSKLLQRKNLCFYGQTSERHFMPYLQDLQTILQRIDMTATDYETISDQLLNNHVVKSRQAANATQSYAMCWLHGHPLDKKKSQYFEHLKRLRQIGIDISVPFDSTRRIPQIKRDRVIQFREVTPPSWYSMPQKTVYPQLALSA